MTSAKLVLSLPEGRSQEFELSKAVVSIGRATGNDVVLLDPTVSRAHARIERTARGFEVAEAGSANGVKVNGLVRARALLAPGDVLSLGDSTLVFEAAALGDELGSQETRLVSGAEASATLMGASQLIHLTDVAVSRLAVHTAQRTWEVVLEGDRLTIGRDPSNDVALDDAGVSRAHAVVERRGAAVTVRDLESANGTWVAGRRVTREVLADGDTFRVGAARLVFKQGFSVGDLTVVETPPELPGGRRPVVVIPGFAGSNLWLGSEQVWPTLRMFDLPELLRIDQPLEARGVVEDVVVVPGLIRLDRYSLLTRYLVETLGYEPGRDLLEFGYDFRQDNRRSARRLAAAIEAWGPTAPITLIAHSMGCLVARYYVERLGGAEKVERVVLLGGPHAGTPYAFAGLCRGPNLLPLGVMNLKLRDVLTTFPSWYQILPTYRCVTAGGEGVDVLAEEAWVAESGRANLRLAREFRRELGTRSSVPAVCIFGYGFKTITGAVVERDRAGGLTSADMVVAANGDGTIPETSAVLKGAEIHPVKQNHGALFVDADVKMRLKLELTREAAPW